jgi:hypothetical protein
MENFLYFRNVAAVADDDGIENSVAYPVSALIGMYPVSDTSIQLNFKNVQRPEGHGNSLVLDNAANLPLVDTVVLNIVDNKGLEAMQDLTFAMTTPIPNKYAGMIIVADDAADSTGGTKYLTGNITSCGTITHNAAYVNA